MQLFPWFCSLNFPYVEMSAPDKVTLRKSILSYEKDINTMNYYGLLQRSRMFSI